ncbi:Flavodoxin-like fold family protein [Rhodococcus sp. AW25M09]|uniref:NAD(P)H-dependent oxidoreductase n=1 Tax=Rhodococcus sp. AW25M09 TaxID=1268303 RepID=UPI0002ACD40E|nr:NAD(P)H-dependent oxidoreductase [Rhodococcus sp. AW25M09]CCQ17963.1 Flavodoxin-like fold family protein [Rhodococcus sp. AW25M09]
MTALVVVSHSDPDSLTHHLAGSLSDAIRAAGGTVETADLAAENFDPRFTGADLNLFRGHGTTPADVIAEQRRIDIADHLVLVFPMYWWSMPALLKGWIDRVFVNGWAYDATPGTFVKKLARLTVHLVVVAGDDAESFERHGVHEAFRTQIERGIVEYTGATVGSTTILYESDSKSRDVLASEIAGLGATVASHVTGRPAAGGRSAARALASSTKGDQRVPSC